MTEQADAALSPVRRICLTVAYDGTDYQGWQVQQDQPTVQGELERALKATCGESISVTGAGRTDAGVHALGQVAHFDTRTSLPCPALEKALNARLPLDIRVREVSGATGEFHARYSAKKRLYRYGILDHRAAERVLEQRFRWVRPVSFDPDLLNGCASLVTGSHDFFTFSREDPERKTSRCEIFRAEWKAGPGRLDFEIEGDRFLRRMVRMLVGAMCAVAEGHAGLDEFRHALESPARWNRAVPAPACGLVLVRVEY